MWAMNRKEYAQAKAELARINEVLREGHLTAEERANLEARSVALTGQLVSPWLPVTLEGRVIALCLVLIGGYGVWAESLLLMMAWPSMVLVSPRLVGGSLYPGGRTSRRHPTD